MRASIPPVGMIKFKEEPAASIDNGFDLIEISSSKTDRTCIRNINENDNLIDKFINLVKNITIESSKELKSFLIVTSLWDLLTISSNEQVPIVNPSIVNYYFAIPDRMAAACKLETDEFFFPTVFLKFTEESFKNANLKNLNRFIYALDRFDEFFMYKLVKIDEFWNVLDSKEFSQVFSTMPRSFSQSFTAFLFKNLLRLQIPFETLKRILNRIIKNLQLDEQSLKNIFMEQFIVNGLIEHRDFSRLLNASDSKNNLVPLILVEILKIWSNDSWIFRTPFTFQLHYCSCLMILLGLIPVEMFTRDMEDSLMNGIQGRLDHSDSQIRLMACCVAESLNRIHPNSENPLDFGLDAKNEIVSHLRQCHGSESKPMDKPLVDCTLEEAFANPIPNNTIDDPDDLKPISSLLKENLVPKNSKSPIPRFLPDCLKVLRSNEDCEVIKVVLNQFSDIFFASSRLSRQLNAASTFNTLLTLQDHFEIKDFDILRKCSMQNVLIDQIKVVGPEIITGMFQSNKLVLGQKMELLSLICSSTQEVFSNNRIVRVSSVSANSPYSANSIASALDHFEQTFALSEDYKPTNSKQQSLINDFLETLCFPLLVQSIKNFHLFKRNHVMFLEKFLWLQAIILNFSQNFLSYDRLAGKFLDFIHLTINLNADCETKTISGASTRLIEQVPIQKAILIGTSVVLSAWPASLSIIDHFPRLQEIYGFLDEIADGPGFKEDSQLQALGTSVALALQDLTDPQKMLKESAEQMTLDFNSIKITKSH